MDNTVKTIADLLQTGGDAAMLFLIYLGFRAVESAREAARSLKDMRDQVTAITPKLDQVANGVRDVAADLESIDSRLAKQDIQLTAALVRQYAGDKG